MTQDIIYDIESYPNVFTITFMNPNTGSIVTFEMSDWCDDWSRFLKFVGNCQDNLARWVGFNNYYYDYQVLHKLLTWSSFPRTENKALLAYKISDKIIKLPKEEKFDNVVWDKDHLVPQVDLYRIHHFDNMARMTSLKKLEFNMRSNSIQDLPYKPGTILTEEEKNELVKYNVHDVKETTKFYFKSKDLIAFREELSEKYGKNFLNHNDTKIGKDYVLIELREAGIECFKVKDGKRTPIQTMRPVIDIESLIFDYIEFKRPEFNAVLGWLCNQKLTETKAALTEIEDLGKLEQYANLKMVKGKVKNLNCIVDNFQFDFGTGGIHGSVEPTIIEESDEFAIIDYDVTSLYPSIAISNGIYPEHLTPTFCDIYATMKEQRLSYPKGTPENAMLKLALNGVYGDSNNPYSPFYDPQYTMQITINGQLMLCMLAEELMGIDRLKIIQINTDGVTVKVPRGEQQNVDDILKAWEETTKLQLERVDYKKMFIRDVNNYIGLYTDGKVKRKGVYEYDMGWHKNHSALVVKKAAEANLIHDIGVEQFIRQHKDMNDFMLRTNVPRSSRLMLETGDESVQLQNTTRYYISNSGGQLVKIMPPLAKKPDLERRININDGFNVTPMNTMGEVKDMNYEWYVNETYKLVDPLWDGMFKDLML